MICKQEARYRMMVSLMGALCSLTHNTRLIPFPGEAGRGLSRRWTWVPCASTPCFTVSKQVLATLPT